MRAQSTEPPPVYSPGERPGYKPLMIGPISWAIALLGALAALATALAIWALRPALARFGLVDRPQARSNHSAPTPRGAGLAILAVIAGLWLVAAPLLDLAPLDLRQPPPMIWAALAILLAISLADDWRGLPVWPRLIAQASAVALGLAALDPAPVFQGLLPAWADLLATGFFWLWFLNLFNFMDGIDAIAGIETASIALGLLALVLAGALDPSQSLGAALLLGAALGFLVWNRPPAKVFLGDVGSIPLGFLIFWLLIEAAQGGQWAAAILLPAYYWFDSALTLLDRLRRRQPIWKSHSDHLYQRAVRAGQSHGRVATTIFIGNLALIAFALGAAQGEIAAALAGGLLVCWLVARRLSRAPKSELAS